MIKNIVGHTSTKKQLSIAAASAGQRNVGMPHILFSGVAGCGKTTMGMELAKACDVDFLPVSPDDFADRDSVLKVLEKLDHSNYDEYGNRKGKIRPTILFVDEIHRMPKKGQEIMGIAMEKLLLEAGQKNLYLWVPHFTLVGATTDDGEQTYSESEIFDIVVMHAVRKNIIITIRAAEAIARRSRGIPRLCVSYLERCHDYQRYKERRIIDEKTAEECFKNLGIDSIGLTKTELRILRTLNDRKEPIGLDNLAIVCNESSKNIKNTIEPYLIQRGFIVRSGKGRVITDKGARHLESGGHSKSTVIKTPIGPDYVRK